MNRPDDHALARRLVAAANELLATAYQLGHRHDGALSDSSALLAEGMAEGAGHLTAARQAYRDRRRRDEIFGNSDLFGEPAWDILLDLYIAAQERKQISITSACIGAAAPSTTALRWLNILEREALIERQGDARDMRRSWVQLTSHGLAKMCDYFEPGKSASARNDAADGRHASKSTPRVMQAGQPTRARRD